MLFAGSDRSLQMVLQRLQNVNILDFITSANTGGGGYLWWWLSSRRKAKSVAAVAVAPVEVESPATS